MTEAQIKAIHAISRDERADGRSLRALYRLGLIDYAARKKCAWKLTPAGRKALKSL